MTILRTTYVLVLLAAAGGACAETTPIVPNPPDSERATEVSVDAGPPAVSPDAGAPPPAPPPPSSGSTEPIYAAADCADDDLHLIGAKQSVPIEPVHIVDVGDSDFVEIFVDEPVETLALVASGPQTRRIVDPNGYVRSIHALGSGAIEAPPTARVTNLACASSVCSEEERYGFREAFFNQGASVVSCVRANAVRYYRAQPFRWVAAPNEESVALSNDGHAVRNTSNAPQILAASAFTRAQRQYFEVEVLASGGELAIVASGALLDGSGAGFPRYHQSGRVETFYFVPAEGPPTYEPYGAGDVIGVAVVSYPIGTEFIEGQVFFSKNGVWLNGDPATLTGGVPTGFTDNYQARTVQVVLGTEDEVRGSFQETRYPIPDGFTLLGR